MSWKLSCPVLRRVGGGNAPRLSDEGGNQGDFAFRIYQYHYRLLDRYGVPVETIAVFTGDRKQRRPSEYRHRVIDTQIDFHYRSYHIFDHSEEELLAKDNVFALIVLACQKALLEGKVPDRELGEDRLTIAKALLRHDYDRDRIISFLAFLKNFLYINDEKINSIFDQQIIQSAGGTINMGVIDVIRKQEHEQGKLQGMQQGAEQKSAEFISNLIAQTDFDDAKIASLAGVAVSLVKKIRTELSKKKQG